MQLLLSFVILTWNSQKYIRSCLRSLVSKCEEEALRFEICLVDNGSSDETLPLVQELCRTDNPPLSIFRLDKNRGTTYSRNIGLRSAKGDFICILDSDTELVSGSVARVLSMLAGNEEIGIIAPRLLLPGGEVQNSVKKFPTFWHKLLKLPKAVLGLPAWNFDFYESFPFPSETYVDTAISACWFLRRELLTKIGFLDERIFYAPEDLDFCARVWKSGKKVLYNPDITLLHNTQWISHKDPLSRMAVSHFMGLLYYFGKHGGWFSVKTFTQRRF